LVDILARKPLFLFLFRFDIWVLILSVAILLLLFGFWKLNGYYFTVVKGEKERLRNRLFRREHR